MIGETISHYKILGKLGVGGMGVVYKAEDTRLKRTVALKFLPSDLTRDEDAKERFILEAQAASALDHPNICTVYEVDESDDGQLFISMAYYEGETLKDTVAKGPLPVNQVLDIAIQACQGLAKAHSRGIVHRDIKSGNIVLTEDGVAKIVDFGLAKLTGVTRVTKTGSTIGTAAYMSPEQARGEQVDQRTDIWSLGVVLYEILTGTPPFNGEYEQVVLYRIMNEEPEAITHRRSDVPVGLERIVEKALQKSPDKRYQRLEEMVEAVEIVRKEVQEGVVKKRRFKLRIARMMRPYVYGAIALFLGAIVAARLFFFTGTIEKIDSIAVLPLENLSRDPEQDYFVDGMTDALISDLAKIKALRVISRTSVMQYKNVSKSLPEIAKELNVAAVVQGAVMRSGERVRITAQLIEAVSDKHLWSETYDRNLADILALQSEIAQAVVKEIRVTLTPQEETRLTSAPTLNKEAYESYLKGRFYWNKRTVENLNKAVAYFNQAIESDPGYARAYAGLADAYIILGVYADLSPEVSFPRAKAAARKALEIDPSIAEAHASLGDISIHFDWDWKTAEEMLKDAIELDPNYATAHHWYSEYLTIMGRHNEALAETKKARELDPLSPIISTWVGWNYYCAQKYDSAIVELRKTLELDRGFPWAHLYLGWSSREMGELNEAISEIQLANQLYDNPQILSSLGHVYALAGRTRDAEKILDQLTHHSKHRFVSAYNFAFVNLGLGRTDKTFEWLEKAYQERSSTLYDVGVDPGWASLRSDPRFAALLKKMGLQASTLEKRSSQSINQNRISWTK